MAKILSYKVEGKPDSFRQLYFYCPGCKEKHAFTNDWKFNNDLEKPTATPSILVTWGKMDVRRCHSYIKDGKIQFLNDCHHNLKGKTVELPECDY